MTLVSKFDQKRDHPEKWIICCAAKIRKQIKIFYAFLYRLMIVDTSERLHHP